MHTYICMIISRSVLLRMRNVWDKNCIENQNTHFMFNNIFFSRKSFRLWDNVQNGQATDDSKIWRMRIAWWITKAKETHSEYVIIVAFPQPRILRERVLILRYKYFGCRVIRAIQIKLLWIIDKGGHFFNKNERHRLSQNNFWMHYNRRYPDKGEDEWKRKL